MSVCCGSTGAALTGSPSPSDTGLSPTFCASAYRRFSTPGSFPGHVCAVSEFSVCLRTGLDTEKFYCGAAKQRRINPGCSLPLSAISQPPQSTWLNQLQWLRAARFFYKPGGRRKRREGRTKSEAHQPTLLNKQVIIIYSTKPVRNMCLKLTFLVS